jgi:hypothetical protein
MPKFSEATQARLTRDYVLPIAHNNAWHCQCYQHIKRGELIRFIELTSQQLTSQRTTLKEDALETPLRAYVYIAVWGYIDGDLEVMLEKALAVHHPSVLYQEIAEQLRDMLQLPKKTAAVSTTVATNFNALTREQANQWACTVTNNAITATSLNEKTPMGSTKTPAFETRHFVFGIDIKSLSDDQLISGIKEVENEIADLKTVKTKSKKITDRISELDGMLKSIVEVLDAR